MPQKQQHDLIYKTLRSSREGKMQCCLSLLHRHLQGVYAGQCTDSSPTPSWTDGVSNKDESAPLVILLALWPVIPGWNRDGLNLYWDVTLRKRKMNAHHPYMENINLPRCPYIPLSQSQRIPRLLLGTALYFIYPKISVRDMQILIIFLKKLPCIWSGAKIYSSKFQQELIFPRSLIWLKLRVCGQKS